MSSNPVSRRPTALVAAFLLALGLAALSDPILATEAADAPPALVAVGFFITGFGTAHYMFAFSAFIAAAAILALRRGRRTWHGGSLRLVAERALYFFAVIALSGIVAQIVKHLVGRSRPRLLATDGAYHFHAAVLGNALASFPSGHTASAFSAAVALSYMRPAWRRWLLAGAVLIGLSRVLVGAHFLSDVVAGATLGTGVSMMVARSFARRGIAFAWRGRRVVIEPLRPGCPEVSK